MARKKAGKKGAGAQPDMPQEFLDDIIHNGVQAHRAGKLSEAEALYRQVLDIQPDHGEANHLLGLIAFQIGQNDQAIQLIKKAIRATPDKAAFHANLGSALQQKGRLDDAISSCAKAIELDPKYVNAFNSRGVTYKTMQRF